MTEDNDLEKAKRIIKEERITKLIGEEFELENYYVVTGINDDYLVVLPNFCTCDHFILRCIKELGSICKHIFAVRISSDNVRTERDIDWKDLLLREH